MKKILFAAVLAGVALVSCTKNEQKVSDPNKIVFDAPVLAPMTKASAELNDTLFPTTRDFSVYAWYTAGDFTTTGAVTYMNDVKVTYNGTIEDNTTPGTGAWVPAQNYYWPKNGKLTFDAYSPSTVNATATAANGISIADYVITASEAQPDVLFSTRVFNKTTSVEYHGKYDGVQIPFKHALCVVKIDYKALSNAAVEAIKIKDIKIVGIDNKGSFCQYAAGVAGGNDAPAWTVADTPTTYTYATASNAADSKNITLAAATADSFILMPQALDANAKLQVVYYIKHGSEYLEQSYETELNVLVDTASPANVVSSWEMGKRYIYHLAFDLEQIYFAPTVTDWVDVNVTVPTIGN